MKIQVFYDNVLHPFQGSEEACLVKGMCEISGEEYHNRDFSEKLLNTGDLEDLLPLRGYYSFVKIKNQKLTISVDHIRSFPLFYSIGEEDILISDQASWIKEQMSNSSLDISFAKEMWLSGFVLGENTLFNEIKQVQAGEQIDFDLTTPSQIVDNKRRFFEYFPKKYENKAIDKHAKNHQNIVSVVFSDLVKRHKGKKLVVPLSGGLDSRFIVSELKKAGCEDVICFSYGKMNNKESLISKRIAAQLGYEWIFVEYTTDEWSNVSKTKEFQDYLFTTDHFCSLPHIQDWLCVKKLKEDSLIPSNSIFLPGHTGDFLATGHIPGNLKDDSSTEEYLSEIIGKHFRVNKFSSLNRKEKEHIKKRILEVVPHKDIKKDGFGRKEMFQYFDWQERQAKFIVNSIRVYDFFGFKWDLPLWDIQLIDFWKNIPFDLKEEKKLYKYCLTKYDDLELFKDVKNSVKGSGRSKGHPIKEALKKIKRRVLREKLFLKKRFLYYFNHPLQWYGIFPYLKIITTKSRIQNINTLLVNRYLNKIKK